MYLRRLAISSISSAIIASLIYFAFTQAQGESVLPDYISYHSGHTFLITHTGESAHLHGCGDPLTIIVAFMLRRWIFIGLMWISSFFSFWVMQSINSVGFIIYFSDLSQKISDVKSAYPSWVINIAGSLYAISILLNRLFLMKKKEMQDLVPKKTMVTQYSVIGVILITAIFILVPVMSSVPAVMFLNPQVNMFEAQETSISIVDGNLVVNYSMPLILEYGNF